MTPEEVGHRLQKVNQLQDLVQQLIAKAEEATDIIESELNELSEALEVALEELKKYESTGQMGDGMKQMLSGMIDDSQNPRKTGEGYGNRNHRGHAEGKMHPTWLGQHSPEPVKRLSVEDLERMMRKP